MHARAQVSKPYTYTYRCTYTCTYICIYMHTRAQVSKPVEEEYGFCMASTPSLPILMVASLTAAVLLVQVRG